MVTGEIWPIKFDGSLGRYWKTILKSRIRASIFFFFLSKTSSKKSFFSKKFLGLLSFRFQIAYIYFLHSTCNMIMMFCSGQCRDEHFLTLSMSLRSEAVCEHEDWSCSQRLESEAGLR